MRENDLLARIQTYFFDFDGTLVESMTIKGEAFAGLFTKPRSDMWYKILKHHLLNGGMNRFEKIQYYYQICNNRKASDKEVQNLGDQFSRGVKQLVVSAPEICGASSFLKTISCCSECYLLSATPHDELKDIVRDRGWSCHFRNIYGYPLSKINIVKQILRDSNLDPQSCIYFGDSIADYEVAYDTKIKYIMVSSRSEMSRYCAEHNIAIISDYAIF